MNNVNILNKLKTILLDNADMLVSDLTQQGEARVIHQVSTSTLTPPTGFYAILVTCSNSREADFVRPSNIGVNVRPTAKRIKEYDIEITVGDEAVLSSEDEEPFEKVDHDFQLFTNRIAQLIIQKDIDKEINLLEGRQIDQLNESDFWDSADGTVAMLYSQLRFTIYEMDDDTLY